MKIQNNDLRILRSCISYKIDNDTDLEPLDIDGLKELSSLLYFFQLEQAKEQEVAQ